ncbi:hypothetical protein FACS1894182_04410 [Bacteroidia bacterium]|nr:hypothetical protein FACS1894182_04410 [Bacteroidia bacterium]
MFVLTGNAQSITVKGKVTDVDDGSPVVGCTVVVKGTNNGTVTDMNGDYSLATEKEKTLVFSYLGYKTQEIKVKNEKLNVVLQPNNQVLSEVVVASGYVRQEKRVLTGAVSSVRNRSVQKEQYTYPVIVVDRAVTNDEEYTSQTENRFKYATEAPFSTFSIDVDIASYSNMRRFINQGQLPPAAAIRTEELINYFSYNYAKPAGKDPVKISAEVGECPWNTDHRLVRIGIKAREIDGEDLPASNLVFLVDVSGSMYGPTRLELVKSSLLPGKILLRVAITGLFFAPTAISM